MVFMGGAVRLDVGFGSITLDASFRSARMGVPTPCFLHGLLNVVIGSCISSPRVALVQGITIEHLHILDSQRCLATLLLICLFFCTATEFSVDYVACELSLRSPMLRLVYGKMCASSKGSDSVVL